MNVQIDGEADGQKDRQTYAKILSVFYNTLPSLGLLPCLLQNCHCNGDRARASLTNDHLLLVGDWFKARLHL